MAQQPRRFLQPQNAGEIISDVKPSLWHIAGLFLRLGATAFGGPLAHIALMRHEFVLRRGWLSDEKFAELIGLTNLIPGPNSTEMAIHLGHFRAGWRGCLFAGAGFILPAVLLTLVVAWFYAEYGRLPQIQALLFGIKPAILAVIVAAVLPLASVTLNRANSVLAATLAAALCFAGLNEVLAMLAGGLFAVLASLGHGTPQAARLFSTIPPLLPWLDLKDLQLAGIFLKIGSILYGSGYVLFAFLDSELVETGFISRAQLIDAVAVGQITPGPVFSAVTFIGYQVNGFSGAIFSTFAIFLPSFVFVLATQRILPRLKKSAVFSAFLQGVNAASIAIIAYALIGLGQSAFSQWSTVAIAAISALGLYFFKTINSAWIVLFGAVSGYILLECGVLHVK